MKKLYYILASIILTACSAEDIVNTFGGGDPLELKGMVAYIDGNAPRSRAAVLGDTVGRYTFVKDDNIVLTNIQRSISPIDAFTYNLTKYPTGIVYTRTDEESWRRTTTDPERIYWSDAESAHTFKGYGCPQGENKPDGFDWNTSETTTNEGVETFYGSLGNPTITSNDTIDYSNVIPANYETLDYSQKNEVHHSGNERICKDDILLAFNDNQKAGIGGQVATVKFYHGLCNVRVIVNISGFAASAQSDDSKSKVTGLVLQDMLTMYKWTQMDSICRPLISTDQNSLSDIYTSSVPAYNQTKPTKAWIRYPEGVGSGNGKTFTFYALAVPTTGKDQVISFDVTYPDPLNPTNRLVTRTYNASLSGVEYRAGHCTTINISLNHANDKMTVGAEYVDWEFVSNPDEGSLKKNVTMLSSAMLNRSSFTIVGDQNATADDATWLYDTGETIKDRLTGQTVPLIKDIYGNNGMIDDNNVVHPYIIRTAQQLVSFAYEVKNGRSFIHRYIMLDADITMQSDITIPKKTLDDGTTVVDFDKLVYWIGIGDSTHSFDGFFLGNGRHINNLYGEAFFDVIGTNAVIDKVDFDNTIEVHGTGVIANENEGLICACNIEGDIVQSQPSGEQQSYCGSFVGNNESFIIACTHLGKVSGHGYVGGLVGKNDGNIIASYHSGLVKFVDGTKDPDETNKTDGWNIGGSSGFKGDNSRIFSCYFNGDLIKHTPSTDKGKVAYPLTTSQMQSNSFVNHNAALADNQFKDIITGEVVTLNISSETDIQKMMEYSFSLNDALSVFRTWLASIPAGQAVTTSCRKFSAIEVSFLKNHYGASHTFQYTPGAYPKVY